MLPYGKVRWALSQCAISGAVALLACFRRAGRRDLLDSALTGPQLRLLFFRVFVKAIGRVCYSGWLAALRPLTHLYVGDVYFQEYVAVFLVAVGGVECFDVFLGVEHEAGGAQGAGLFFQEVQQ